MPEVSSRRTFFKQAAAGASALAAAHFLPTALLPAQKLGLPAQAAAWRSDRVVEPLRICLLSGSAEYESDACLTAFQTRLEADGEFTCSRAFATAVDQLPGLEHLADCDCLLLFARRLTISGDELAKVKDYCQSGRPIVGVRTASHAFQNWLELDKEILGGDYQNHYGAGPKTSIRIAPGAEDHPILNGFVPYESEGSLYKNPRIAADTTVLLQGSIPQHEEPIAWTRERPAQDFANEEGPARQHPGLGRVFYTSLGHQADFKEENFLRLLTQALRWACGR